jgi:hypothetical protein
LAKISFAGGKELSGLGYVEQLVMTAEPWRLPIQTLRWGRFLHPQAAIVWIDWVGEHSCRVVLHDGVRVEAAIPNDHEVLWSGARLTMDCGAVLRSGALGETVFNVVRSAARWLPARMLRVRETKWRSRCTLRSVSGSAGASILEGWAIHEKVEWT